MRRVVCPRYPQSGHLLRDESRHDGPHARPRQYVRRHRACRSVHLHGTWPCGQICQDGELSPLFDFPSARRVNTSSSRGVSTTSPSAGAVEGTKATSADSLVPTNRKPGTFASNAVSRSASARSSILSANRIGSPSAFLLKWWTFRRSSAERFLSRHRGAARV
jgi:hypothetical protein